jgi:hypothetical protein
MLEAYYPILVILTGDLFDIIGPFPNRSADDAEIIRQFVTSATALSPRGLWCMGESFVEDLEFNSHVDLMNLLGVQLVAGRYIQHSGNTDTCIDLIPAPVITTSGDIWGLRNSCARGSDVLLPVGDGEAASYYEQTGPNTDVAGVFVPQEPAGHPQNHWQSLVEGWDIAALMNRTCDNTNVSTRWHSYPCAVTNGVFARICAVASICIFGDSPATSTAIICPCTPRTGGAGDGGRPLVNLAGLGNNPLRHGSAVIHLSLERADRVTVKIYDVSGRLVRTLANGQIFPAGRVDPVLTWDGVDDRGQRVARGTYFVNVRYERSRYEVARKMIVLR